jgi:predicted MFS family arabinose efflux permease
VLGALVAGLLTSRTTRTRAVLGATVLIAVGQIGQGVVPAYLGYVVLAVVVGAVLGILNASLFALLFDEVDPARWGSVLALVCGMARAATGFALLLGGAIGTVAGPRVAYLVAGGAGLAVAAAAVVIHRLVDTGHPTGRDARRAA